ncbi:MAG: RNA polymerase factor sigma-32 [Alphaproteobacteria bacterium]|nr:RNA polymerase factor sigma-32 [Alphaproteobacteria bacterium]MBN2675302.1 RNA polymerase factor sigma-32 [Alphaproteobacteria bacterium]
MVARGVSDESGLEQYIQNIQKFPILSAQQEYEYASLWQTKRDKLAAEKLVSSHLRLVVSVAYDFRNYGIPVSDLIASGNMGLMQALQKFDPERGFRFSTYAMFWIKAEIYETILSNWSIVKIGTSANQKRVFFNLSRAKKALGIMDNNLSEDQTKKVAEFLQVPENDVTRMATRVGARDLSLNTPVSDSDTRDALSNLEDKSEGIEDNVEKLEFRRRGYALLRKHLSELPERDREILRARKLQDPVATLEILAQKYEISRERVRQIEERAYKKLRDAILKESEG